MCYLSISQYIFPPQKKKGTKITRINITQREREKGGGEQNIYIYIKQMAIPKVQVDKSLMKSTTCLGFVEEEGTKKKKKKKKEKGEGRRKSVPFWGFALG